MRHPSNSSFSAFSAHAQLGRGDSISARADAKRGAGKLHSNTARPHLLLRVQGREVLRYGVLQKLIASRTAGYSACSEQRE
jgi:hypothetical protein